ncbi:MAG: endopeptidase La [Lachnospiraceae bacterium]|nr:endopeptidase La [Lachnospiraceae bacterium]
MAVEKRYIVIPVFHTVLASDTDTGVSVEEVRADLKKRIEQEGNEVVLVNGEEMEAAAGVMPESGKGENTALCGVKAKVQGYGISQSGSLIHVHTENRVQLSNLQKDDTLPENVKTAQIRDAAELIDMTPQEETETVQSLLEKLKNSSAEGSGSRYFPEGGENGGIRNFAVFFGNSIGLTPKEQYALLAEDSLRKKADLLTDFVDRYVGGSAEQAQNAQKNAGGKREKDYRRRIEESGMPADAREEVEKVLDRYLSAQPGDPERGSMESYLDFVTELKWRLDDTPEPDLHKAREILNRDHYGLDKVKGRILQQIAVMALKHDQAGSILLLVGAPGTGKTSMGKSIAEALGRKYVRISLGGVRDEAEIRGHRRTYIGAMPGRIMDGIKRSGSMNPVVVLDEIDKLGTDYNGDPAAALLEVLDPEQNNTFTDHYLNIPYNLSNVFFICTANSVDTIPGPLYDRMEVISLSGYTPMEKMQIAKRYLLPRARKDAGIANIPFAIEDPALRRIIDEYTMEAGVRGLKKQLDILCRHRAAEVVEEMEQKSSENAVPSAGENEWASVASSNTTQPAGAAAKEQASAASSENSTQPAGTPAKAQAAESADAAVKPAGKVITAADIPHYLGNKHLIHDRILAKPQVGVVTGLAWTQAGGEILFIESRVMKGSGQIIVTGQLGDVMKESARISASLVKSLFMSDDLTFDDKDIHIHVPEGAVKKDGPSAGVTLFTALTSLVTGIPVSNELAMTGEVSLRGQVMPIGGLPEKLMAADRAGVKKVLIPKDNVQDLEDVPKETRDHLNIVPVSTIQDVAREALGISLPAYENAFQVTVKKAAE